MMLLFSTLDLSFVIQKSSLAFYSDRHIDVYFPPVSLDGKSAACLQMNFTAFTYFVLKLAYVDAFTNVYKERMLFRSTESLGKRFRHWKMTVTPDMTEGEEFVVILHARSSSVGPMAVINSINLQLGRCNKTGKRYAYEIYR